MLAYWIVKGLFSLPFFNNLNISDSAISSFSSIISYINAFNQIFNVRLIFSLLYTFFGVLLIALVCRIVFRFLFK